MDSEKCKTLLKVLELGSLSEAAAQLGYTPSGVSRMIASMEEDAGFSLLIRSRKGVSATKECEELLPVMRKLNYYGEQYTQTAAKINGIEIGEINIGTSYRTYYPWLTKLISIFHKDYPYININIISKNSTELLQAMDEMVLDFCIISRREGSYTWIPLQENPHVAWLPKNHKYANSSVPLSLFETETYIETYPKEDTDNARILKANGIKPNTTYTTTDNYATYCLVEAGLGIALNNGLNSDGWSGDVVIRPLDPPQTVKLGIACPLDTSLSPAAKRFISFLQENAKSTL